MGQEQQPPLQKPVNMVQEHHQQKESEEQEESNKVCEEKQQEQEQEEQQSNIYQEVMTKGSVPIPSNVEFSRESSTSGNYKNNAATTTSTANNKTSTDSIDNNINQDQQKYAVKLEEQVRECMILMKEEEQLQRRVCMLESQSEHNSTMSRDFQALVRDKNVELMVITREKEQL